MVPDMECHAQLTAAGMTASGQVMAKKRCKTSVLHTHLDGNGVVLRFGEVEQFAHAVTREIAQGVVAQHYGEDRKEESYALRQ